MEIKEVKPKIILAFGNTNLKFFMGQNSGIMGKNAHTTWNEYYGTFICWCIHPAAKLHNPENSKLFSSGITTDGTCNTGSSF